jgi:hypothetical protein
MRRRVRIAVALIGAAIVLAPAGCGDEDAAGTTEELAASIQDAVDDEISFGHAYGVLDAECDRSNDGGYACTVSIAATPDAIQEELEVELGDDGCWVATRVALARATGRSLDESELPPRVIKGCLE